MKILQYGSLLKMSSEYLRELLSNRKSLVLVFLTYVMIVLEVYSKILTWEST